jgi:hypothetical protein
MLVQRRDPNLRSYFCWGLYQGVDTEEQARQAAQKYAAPNAVHFWMPEPDISRDLATVLKLGAGRTPFDVYLLYRPRVLWETLIPQPTYWQQQIGLLQGDPYDITKLETRIRQLQGR